MSLILVAVAAVVLAQAKPVSSENAKVMAAVRQFVEGFNKGDTKKITEVCAAQMAIIDEFPPYEWHGPAAVTKWLKDYDADAKKNAITDGYVTADNPRHVDISGDRAYVVVPANYWYKRNRKPVTERGSVYTLTLQKGASGWKITGWAWAKN